MKGHDMDEAVLAAIAHWPKVPHVYGWLSLDRRGKWRLQGSPIANPHITDFIGRNYESDERGAWFFQNGPQRVYVRLDYTPWVLRIGDRQSLISHTGTPLHNASSALLDENGNLLIAFERSIGLVEDRDLPALLNAVVDAQGEPVDETVFAHLMAGEDALLTVKWQSLCLPLKPILSKDIPSLFSYVTDPQPADLG
jgi:Protein of unknown function (DUF2946)